MIALAQRLSTSDRAAVAPIVAMSLFGLIAVGGIAFDYARLASMDSELQTAADQAALAAASQLDGKDGACARAALAASTLIANNTRFANEGGSAVPKIIVENEGTCDRTGNIRFYSSKEKTDTGTMDDAAAKFVEVTVNGRTANYALTPIVGALSSGLITATAFAGIDSAVCGVVPFFVCNPDEPADNDEDDYPTSIASGTGMLMLEGGQQKGPGNFGFLAYAGRGGAELKDALSNNVSYEQCTRVTSSTTVETEPGQKEAVFASLNNRFDIPSTCPSGTCSPSTNVRKDLVRDAANCTWMENPSDATNFASKRYRPLTNAALPTGTTPQVMGHPRDICHAVSTTGSCTAGQIGDGVWDRAAYFRSNHPGLDWSNATGLDRNSDGNVTRYETYLWEAEQEALTANTTLVDREGAIPSLRSYGTPQALCLAPGVAPDAEGLDRRRVTAAVVNCRAYGKINGRKTIPVSTYIDVFLVEPSINRYKYGASASNPKVTNRDDIYVEVIGLSGSGGGGGAGQITRRDVPYLIE